MKKEWIMSEEEKQNKRAKIERNKNKKKQPHTNLNSHNSNSNTGRKKFLSSPLSPICVSNDKYNNCNKETKITFKESVGIKNTLFGNNSTNNCVNVISESAINEVNLFPINSLCTEDNFLNSKLNDFTSVSSQISSSFITKNISTQKQCEQYDIKSEIMCTMSNELSNTSIEFQSNSSFSGSHQIVSSLLSEKDDLYLPCSSHANKKFCLNKSEKSTKILGELEANKLQELVMANEILKMPLSCWVHDPNLLDVINMTDLAIRRLIKMSTRISGFKILCQDDQIALLKGGCTELMILRSVMLYDPEKECWKGPGGPTMSIKMDILKEAKGNLYEEHKKFINSFLPSWRSDENIMLLLSAITLFTPHRPCTIHKDVIQMEQEIYYYLLKKYLNTLYSENEANITYKKLINILKDLHILNEENIKVYLDVNPKDVEPLLIEIFDLKH